jgi:hypothetical protein
MSKALLVAAAAIFSMPAIAADMYAPTSSPIVDELAQARAIAKLCRASDGAVLNADYWRARAASVPISERARLAREVLAREQSIEASVSPGGAPDWCDDRLDELTDRYGYAVPGSTNPGPVCWSDPLGLSGCAGIGADDPLAGLDTIDEGF